MTPAYITEEQRIANTQITQMPVSVNAVEQLSSMFTAYDNTALAAVLESCGGNFNRTVDVLLSMEGDTVAKSPGPLAGKQRRQQQQEKPQQQQPQQQEQKEQSSTVDPSIVTVQALPTQETGEKDGKEGEPAEPRIDQTTTVAKGSTSVQTASVAADIRSTPYVGRLPPDFLVVDPDELLARQLAQMEQEEYQRRLAAQKQRKQKQRPQQQQRNSTDSEGQASETVAVKERLSRFSTKISEMYTNFKSGSDQQLQPQQQPHESSSTEASGARRDVSPAFANAEVHDEKSATPEQPNGREQRGSIELNGGSEKSPPRNSNNSPRTSSGSSRGGSGGIFHRRSGSHASSSGSGGSGLLSRFRTSRDYGPNPHAKLYNTEEAMLIDENPFAIESTDDLFQQSNGNAVTS
eukprot:Clim_evm4s68 gene=Clim_evmTU4s68